MIVVKNITYLSAVFIGVLCSISLHGMNKGSILFSNGIEVLYGVNPNEIYEARMKTWMSRYSKKPVLYDNQSTQGNIDTNSSNVCPKKKDNLTHKEIDELNAKNRFALRKIMVKAQVPPETFFCSKAALDFCFPKK